MQSLETKQQLSGETEKIVKLRTKFLTDLMTQLAQALPVELGKELIGLYVQGLMDLREEEIRGAFNRALTDCLFFPKIAELRVFVADHRKLLAQRKIFAESKTLLARADKPEQIEKMETLYASIDARRARQRLEDLAYVETLTDADWPNVTGRPQGRYVDYVRRKEARAGVPLVPAAQHSEILRGLTVVAAQREPGDESE